MKKVELEPEETIAERIWNLRRKKKLTKEATEQVSNLNSKQTVN